MTHVISLAFAGTYAIPLILLPGQRHCQTAQGPQPRHPHWHPGARSGGSDPAQHRLAEAAVPARRRDQRPRGRDPASAQSARSPVRFSPTVLEFPSFTSTAGVRITSNCPGALKRDCQELFSAGSVRD